MAVQMIIMTKALVTPGIARPSAMMILLSDLMRLKSRKTRKARSMRNRPSGLSGDVRRARDMQPTITTMKSKTFHPDFQNSQNQLP
jgi:hypothetical protein